jgi:Protein of unknown function (DUF1488)
MSLSFPNQSRFYDATRCAVRFWGHDSAMEASFFVTADALKRIKPDIRQISRGYVARLPDLVARRLRLNAVECDPMRRRLRPRVNGLALKLLK